MLLRNVSEQLETVRQEATNFLGIQSPVNDDYRRLETALRELSKEALIGTQEYFHVDAIVSKVAMDKSRIQVLTQIGDKADFREFCKGISREISG